MKFYYRYYVTYHNNTRIGGGCSKCLSETPPVDETISFSWDNIDDLYAKYGLSCSFNLWHKKKGRLVSFFCDKFLPIGNFGDVKEWKHSDLNITLKIFYKEYNPSIDEVLKWRDGEKAILYLKERGLNICPKP